MALDTDIRDQAYEFFVQEAPELLQVIEEELLNLRQERSIAKIHNMMRAAHSLKGGAASLGMETIKTLAHSLEDIFKALFNEDLEIDAEVENLLLQAYDCLRVPLTEQITTGQYNSDQAMANAEPVFTKIEARLGDFLGGSAELPGSIELGVDIALSIFDVDVAQGLERLELVLANPQANEVAGELRAQAEVFAGLAELLNLPGFGAIASSALAALEAHPAKSIEITQIAFADFQLARLAVIAGDRIQGGAPSTALLNFTSLSHAPITATVTPSEVVFEQAPPIATNVAASPVADFSFLPLDNVFGDLPISSVVDEISVPSLDNIFGDFNLNEQNNNQEVEQIFSAELVEPRSFDDKQVSTPSLDDLFGDALDQSPATHAIPKKLNSDIKTVYTPESIQELVASVEQSFDSLPSIQDITADNSTAIVPAPISVPTVAPAISTPPQKLEATAIPAAPTVNLSVRVDLERLQRMNNLMGELSINRNGLALQNEQLQTTVQELLRRFGKFQQMGQQLRTLSDQMLVAPDRYGSMAHQPNGQTKAPNDLKDLPLQGGFPQTDFDSLEMDSYGELHSLLQGTLEEIVQLEETVGDVVLFAGQSNQTLELQRQRMNHLRDELMWARMLPLGEVLNRFPRMLRDLSNSYEKPVELKLTGTGVLVDKAALEKLYDPLLHLVRNAFDHGIEQSDVRRKQGKSEQGRIEIRAYHQGSQTIIEVRDDGQGLNLERVRSKAIDMGLVSAEQLVGASTNRLSELLFEPGFSTASQVSELSGRGVGLDVVRSQMRSLKGNVSVSFEPGKGTTFTLRIPLTLSVAKLLVGFVGTTAFALPSDSIEEILIPQAEQLKYSGGRRFLHWQDQIIPTYHLSEILNYACPLPETIKSQALEVVPSPEDWAPPMLLLSQDNQILAIEIDRLVSEQELVIKPFGAAIAPPSYIYGCTILGDGSLIPVIDGANLINFCLGRTKTIISATTLSEPMNEESFKPKIAPVSVKTAITPTILVVDDSITLRQTLALTLQKANYRVLQAGDGREAIEQLQKNSTIQLVVCDVEMPNMNGFEFLSHRRQDPLMLKIPTVMLTSRSSDKHRQLAKHLGANAYFTKPYIEQEFITAIKATITQSKPVAAPALSHAP